MNEQHTRKGSDLSPRKAKPGDRGKLKIGDDWNAIRIIALSQSNPLKAIAEFVENSIDARAKTITITRGRKHGEHYLARRTPSFTWPNRPRAVGWRSRGPALASSKISPRCPLLSTRLGIPATCRG